MDACYLLLRKENITWMLFICIFIVVDDDGDYGDEDEWIDRTSDIIPDFYFSFAFNYP